MVRRAFSHEGNPAIVRAPRLYSSTRRSTARATSAAAASPSTPSRSSSSIRLRVSNFDAAAAS
eukprot:30700-Pelagococcus_subviridis.AAC.1